MPKDEIKKPAEETLPVDDTADDTPGLAEVEVDLEEEKETVEASGEEAVVSAASAPPEPTEAQVRKQQGEKFIQIFGAERGPLYFTQGLTFEEATVAHMQWQQERITNLSKKLGAKGEDAPLSISPENKPERKPMIEWPLPTRRR